MFRNLAAVCSCASEKTILCVEPAMEQALSVYGIRLHEGAGLDRLAMFSGTLAALNEQACSTEMRNQVLVIPRPLLVHEVGSLFALCGHLKDVWFLDQKGQVRSLFARGHRWVGVRVGALELVRKLCLRIGSVDLREYGAGAYEHNEGHAYVVAIPRLEPYSEPHGEQQGVFYLYEEQQLLQGSQAHDAIRYQGEGRFSLWNEQLYFSATDNSNPAQNGRRYRCVVATGWRRHVLKALRWIERKSQSVIQAHLGRCNAVNPRARQLPASDKPHSENLMALGCAAAPLVKEGLVPFMGRYLYINGVRGFNAGGGVPFDGLCQVWGELGSLKLYDHELGVIAGLYELFAGQRPAGVDAFGGEAYLVALAALVAEVPRIMLDLAETELFHGDYQEEDRFRSLLRVLLDAPRVKVVVSSASAVQQLDDFMGVPPWSYGSKIDNGALDQHVLQGCTVEASILGSEAKSIPASGWASVATLVVCLPFEQSSDFMGLLRLVGVLVEEYPHIRVRLIGAGSLAPLVEKEVDAMKGDVEIVAGVPVVKANDATVVAVNRSGARLNRFSHKYELRWRPEGSFVEKLCEWQLSEGNDKVA